MGDGNEFDIERRQFDPAAGRDDSDGNFGRARL